MPARARGTLVVYFAAIAAFLVAGYAFGKTAPAVALVDAPETRIVCTPIFPVGTYRCSTQNASDLHFRCAGPYFGRESMDMCMAADGLVYNSIGVHDLPATMFVMQSSEAASRHWVALGEAAVGIMFACMCILVYNTYITVQ